MSRSVRKLTTPMFRCCPAGPAGTNKMKAVYLRGFLTMISNQADFVIRTIADHGCCRSKAEQSFHSSTTHTCSKSETSTYNSRNLADSQSNPSPQDIARIGSSEFPRSETFLQLDHDEGVVVAPEFSHYCGFFNIHNQATSLIFS